MKKSPFYFFVLSALLALWPVFVQAQYLAWHYDRLIEDNASRPAHWPQVAISGSKAVAVWYQSDGTAYRIYSNYSTNGGATWHTDRLIEDNTDNIAYYPHVAMSGNVVVAAWIQGHNGQYRVFSNYSKDGGATWHADQIIEDDMGGHAGYPGPNVSVSGSRVVVVWPQSDDFSHIRIYANYSTNGGATWHSRQTIDNATAYDSSQPWVAISGLNAVAAFVRFDGANYRIYYNYSTDGGAAWHANQLLEDNAGYDGFYPVRVVISGTKAVAVWYQASPIGSCVYANNSTDGGATWAGAQILKDPVTSSATGPHVAISGTRVVAVWMQYDTSGFHYICSNYSTDSGATWHYPHGVEANSSYAPSLPHVALSGSNAVAVWRQPDGSGDRVFTNYSTNGGASWFKLRALDGIAGTTAGDCFPKVAVSGNKVVAVWVANDGVSDRIVSNYANYFAKEKYFLRPPKLNGPANGSVSVAQPVILSWQDTNDPSGPQELKYRIRIKPAGGVYTFINVPPNSVIYAKSGLARNKIYSWNVQAVGNGTSVLTSSWANGGVDWKFTTAN